MSNTVGLKAKQGKLTIVAWVCSAKMQLKEFSLISPVIESGTVLKALETAIPSEAIEQAISKTKAGELRKIVNVNIKMQNFYEKYPLRMFPAWNLEVVLIK